MEFYQHMESIENLKESKKTKEILMYTLESFEKFKNEQEKQRVKLIRLHNLLLEIKDASNGEFVFTEDNLQAELLSILKDSEWLGKYCDLKEIRYLQLEEVKEALRYPEEEPVILKKVVEAMELINNIHQTDIESEIRVLEDSEMNFCGIDYIRNDILKYFEGNMADNEITIFNAYQNCVLGYDVSSLKDLKIDMTLSSLEVAKELEKKQNEYNLKNSVENKEVTEVERQISKAAEEQETTRLKKYNITDCVCDKEYCCEVSKLAYEESALELEIRKLRFISALKQIELNKAIFANEYLMGNIGLETYSDLMDDYNNQMIRVRHSSRDELLKFQSILCFDERTNLTAQRCYGKLTGEQYLLSIKKSTKKSNKIRAIMQERRVNHDYGYKEEKDTTELHKFLKSS